MSETDYSDVSDFALGFEIIFERLRRIEERLGIDEPTPAELEFDRRNAYEGDA